MKHRPHKTGIYQSTALIAVVLLLLILFISAGYFFLIPSHELSAEQRLALAEIEERRIAWRKSEPESYQYRLSHSTFVLPYSVEVTVSGGISQTTFADDSARTGEAAAPPGLTSIDDVFDQLESAARTAARIEVTYHERYGFPTFVGIDWHADTTDDEESLRVERFIALER